MNKKKYKWLVGIGLYAVFNLATLNYILLSPEERIELWHKFNPLGYFPQALHKWVIVTFIVFLTFILGNILSYFCVIKRYRKIASNYNEFPSWREDIDDLKEYENKYYRWCRNNIKWSVPMLMPAIIGIAMMLVWLVAVPDNFIIIDTMTPSVGSEGLLVTVIGGVVVATLYSFPTTLFLNCKLYGSFSNYSNFKITLLLVAVCITDILAAFMIVKVYSIWMLPLIPGSFFMGYILWPQTPFDKWCDKVRKYQLERRSAWRDSDYDYDGGGDYTSNYKESKTETFRHQRKKQLSRADRAVANIDYTQMSSYHYGRRSDRDCSWNTGNLCTIGSKNTKCEYSGLQCHCPYFEPSNDYKRRVEENVRFYNTPIRLGWKEDDDDEDDDED
ncbi:MAG: hypothetical protein K2J96_06655 [Bacteroidaceae bacterium]|nr:hypothetical protein [Bacteroidaceae bacterium]